MKTYLLVDTAILSKLIINQVLRIIKIINQVLRIIKIAVKSDVKNGRI